MVRGIQKSFSILLGKILIDNLFEIFLATALNEDFTSNEEENSYVAGKWLTKNRHTPHVELEMQDLNYPRYQEMLHHSLYLDLHHSVCVMPL